MSLLSEIRTQHPTVRTVMYWLSVTAVLGGIGFVWFTAIERDMFFALHSDAKDRQEFLVRQQERSPQGLAWASRAFGSLTASIGSLLGFDTSRGFDSGAATGHNQDAVHLLPLSQ